MVPYFTDDTAQCKLPILFYKWQALKHIKKELSSQAGNTVATTILSASYSKTFSASNVHCLCIRNGRVFSWGDNSGGRLGRLPFTSSIVFEA